MSIWVVTATRPDDTVPTDWFFAIYDEAAQAFDLSKRAGSTSSLTKIRDDYLSDFAEFKAWFEREE